MSLTSWNDWLSFLNVRIVESMSEALCLYKYDMSPYVRVLYACYDSDDNTIML